MFYNYVLLHFMEIQYTIHSNEKNLKFDENFSQLTTNYSSVLTGLISYRAKNYAFLCKLVFLLFFFHLNNFSILVEMQAYLSRTQDFLQLGLVEILCLRVLSHQNVTVSEKILTFLLKLLDSLMPIQQLLVGRIINDAMESIVRNDDELLQGTVQRYEKKMFQEKLHRMMLLFSQLS